MSSDNPSGNYPNTGFTVLFMYFVYAGVLVLTYFFGWVVLAVFAVLWAAAMVFAYFDDKRQCNTSVDPDAPLSAAADELDEYCDAQGLCLTCGSSVFSVEPGVTTAAQISNFAVNAEGWRENPEAVAGWMPPGLYCPKGCFNIHATPVPSIFPEPGYSALAEQLAQFEDLYALANKVGKNPDVYEKERSFVDYYRRGNRRFFATMLIRSIFECEVCQQRIGEAELHYEDPAQPIQPDVDDSAPALWGKPAGRYCDIRRSQLHGILEHGEPVPEDLARLCDGGKA